MEDVYAESLRKDARLPEDLSHVHIMGVGGTGMSALAGLFKAAGIRVTGSDSSMYPPVSDLLHELDIMVMTGYSPANLWPRPDLVVVGNVIRRSNPEAIAVEKHRIPYASMPDALRRYFLTDKKNIVITGTHGKTTVSSMVAWILHEAGLNPGFLIGGIPRNFCTSSRLGTGEFFVVEGDEYDTAFFDKTPKFLHFSPHVGVITSCEYDHADIYESIETIEDQFLQFCGLIVPGGRLVAHLGDQRVRRIAVNSKCSVAGYGLDPLNDWSVKDWVVTSQGVRTTILRQGVATAAGTLPMFGVHNILNALAAVAVAEAVGVHTEAAFEALKSFKGVLRRQQILGEHAGILVMDDFAHHPTAVRETCSGLRARFPNRRLVAVFEPRSNTSRRSVFQKVYPESFLQADITLVMEPSFPSDFPTKDRFDSRLLASDLRSRGREAHCFDDTQGILVYLQNNLRSGDVVILMSNGSFGDLGKQLMGLLMERV